MPLNVKNIVYQVLVMGVSYDLQMCDTRVLHKIFYPKQDCQLAVPTAVNCVLFTVL